MCKAIDFVRQKTLSLLIVLIGRVVIRARICWDYVVGRDHAAGGGTPKDQSLTRHDVQAIDLVRQKTRRFWSFDRRDASNPNENLWGLRCRRGHAGSPGSGGASPYLRRGS
jgi:hypothetical protein